MSNYLHYLYITEKDVTLFKTHKEAMDSYLKEPNTNRGIYGVYSLYPPYGYPPTYISNLLNQSSDKDTKNEIAEVLLNQKLINSYPDITIQVLQ